MNELSELNRRTALKLASAAIAGGTSLVGTASAGGAPLPRLTADGRHVFGTWGDGEIWEITDAEPSVHFPQEPDFEEPRIVDSEGDDHAHEPLYIIEPVPDAEHSPHFPAPPNSPVPFEGIDHTVPVPGGTDKQYSAQWHPKFVVDAAQPFICVALCGTEKSVMFPNFTNQDGDGNYLTSSTAIENADNVLVLSGPEEAVFTCPVRPHDPSGD